MKTFTSIGLSLLLLLIIAATPAKAQQTPVTSQIENATVYLSGAQLTRSAGAQLSAGNNILVFEGLSSLLNEQSVQMKTNLPVTVLSIRKNIGNDLASDSKLDSLQQLQQGLQTDLEMKQAEQSVIERELNILLNNQQLRGENQKITAGEIKEAMDYFRQKLTEIETSKIEIRNAISEINNKLNEVNRQISLIRQQARQRSGQIIAEIQSPRTQRVAFELTYFIANAGWYPSYDVRVEDIDQPLELTYKANVYQNTGIDWEDVSLTVSSAEPMTSTSIPSIQPWYLDFWEAVRQRQGQAKAQRADEALHDLAAPMTSEREISVDQATGPQVSVNQRQTSFSFTIDTPYTITGNGKRKAVGLQQHSLPATYRYVATPKVRETAFLTAMLTDWGELNLLNGQANLYFENTYVGESAIQIESPEDTLRFSLGKDEGIIIERNRLRQFSEKNFFGNRTRETEAWELTVRNTKGQPIELTLVDQIPVSTNEDIKVNLQERSGGALVRATGKLSWKLTVDPNSTQSRTLRYMVEYPTGKRISRQ